MTFTAFTLYALEYDQQHHKERAGQSAFNALWNVRPDLANAVRGGGLDPFHDDTALAAFWRWLGENW